MEKDIGHPLSEAKPDIAKIALNCLLRGTCTGIILWVGYAEQGFSTFWGCMFLAFSAVAAFPLRHLKDRVEFFSNGMTYHQKQWTLEELGVVSWVSYRPHVGFFEELYMDTDAGRFVFTYVKHPKKQFNRAYGKQMNGAKVSWN